ncbi:MAG: hypothetical protein NVSMB25_24540 [Thermoleophilaceae bacterium]
MQTIDAEQLKSRLDGGDSVVVIDARPPESFAAGHIPGAVSGKSDDIIELAPKLAPDRQASVVTYCGSLTCRRSLRAAERLEQLGYTNVLEYEGGLADWRDRGLPTEE